MLSIQKQLQLKQFIKMYSICPNTIIMLDYQFNCIHTTNADLFPLGTHLSSFLCDHTVTNPLKRFVETIMFKNNTHYCIRIHPVTDELDEPWLYICEIIDADAALNISQKTDMFTNLLSTRETLEMSMAEIWRNISSIEYSLKEKQDYENLQSLYSIDKCTANIGSVTKNYHEYLIMLQSKPKTASVDLAALCRFLVKKCNAALAKCGRRVELLAEPDDLEVCIDQVHAVVALINSIQNSLLYSPVDTVPLIKVYRKQISHRNFVEISIINENIMFTRQDFKEKLDINFNYQRIGFGIPIIKAFMKESNGIFNLDMTGEKVVLTLTFKADNEGIHPKLRVENSEIFEYKCSIPDFTEIKMREVVAFFGEIDN